LQERGGVHWLVLTGRDGIGKVREIQTTFDCQILIHEQEAYLLPGLPLTQFEQEFSLTDDSRMLWTPGHSPGSACLYHRSFGGVLFSGRHLLPSPQGKLMPLQTAKTFHWRRQLRSVQRLLEDFTLETLQYVCPGANTGFLRGKHLVENAYEQLSDLKLEVLT
jgi:glyoxylase-like metal-dependent hydrolase (beta-lactamase superfamily II)